MLGFNRKQEASKLEEAINAVYAEMAVLTADSPEYAKCVDQLDKLYRIKDPQSKDRAVFKDWIPVIASVGSIALIMVYEQRGHSFTSKAASFIRKP